MTENGRWFRLPRLEIPLTADTDDILALLCNGFGLDKNLLAGWRIYRLSLDARGRGEPRWNYIIDVRLKENIPAKSVLSPGAGGFANVQEVKAPEPPEIVTGSRPLTGRPVVVGLGPAGLFAALRLAEYGYRPLVLDRGDGLTERVEKVEYFWQKGTLDPESNMQFGSGGAGTFSDGKLVTRIRSPYLPYILSLMVEMGAPSEISYWHKPHVGTDRLRPVVEGLQKRITRLGGQIKFRTKVTGLVTKNGRITALRTAGGEEIETGVTVLAVGNASRELYAELAAAGIPMEIKPFAVGLRVEHPQELIDRVQYGSWAGHPRLGAADYRLTFHHRPTGRGVYSFCMCPGGLVVASSTEENGVVTNGMSYYARDSGVANSALVVTVGPGDFDENDILAGISFQRFWERKAFHTGGGGYKAPAQKVRDFLEGRPTREFKGLYPTYRPAVTPCDLHDCLPSFISDPLKDALRYFNRLIPGFTGSDAVLTGVETRTSAPVRLLRDDNHRSVGVDGLYPCGEGSGYSGGITSSAVDGLKTADRIISEYAPPREKPWV